MVNQSKNGRTCPRPILICSCWLRSALQTTNVSHQYLLDIVQGYCRGYCVSSIFEWDSLTKHRNLVVSNEGKTFTDCSRNDTPFNFGRFRTKSLCSTNELSANTSSLVHWELTLKHKGFTPNGHRALQWFRMGFVDSEHVRDFKDGEGMGWQIMDGEHPVMYSSDHSTNLHHNWRFFTKEGDKFRLDFDFKSGECTAFYNGELVGMISAELPQRLYIVASVRDRGTSLETSLFEII